ncbi:MAG: glycosyltransferase family 4 protein [Chloroflexi bacterium]|nr:glycosyltransferase family 4 protein [Chloroflexota bacterium]
MRILIALTYYRPHTSGLTIYAERIARALAARGHSVTVLTSHYRKDLPYEETCDGVKIVRVPVLARISKGVIMPTFGLIANKLVAENDWIQLHLPQFDAAGIALRGRLLRKPTVVTYHCDLHMPPGILAWAANQGVLFMNDLTARFTHKVVTYTQDYADYSPYLSGFKKKIRVFSPPVVLPETDEEAVTDFIAENNPDGRSPVIGMAARLATEKGVEVLLSALPAILNQHPSTRVLFAGPYKGIIGEEDYARRLDPMIKRYEESGVWKFVGELNPQRMAAFYKAIDVLVLPSLNSTEAFGLVQIEAMLNGVPSVASNLPGVRQPVKRHGMGAIAEIGSAESLANAVLKVLDERKSFSPDKEKIRMEYDPDRVAEFYEELFTEISCEISGNDKQ